MQQRQQQHQHGYASQDGVMVAPGQQNQYQQMQRSPQAWQGGQQGGRAASELRDSRAKIAEYEQQLEYYQEQARQLDQTVRLIGILIIIITIFVSREALNFLIIN